MPQGFPARSLLGVAERVVVVHLVQRSVQAIVPIDVRRGTVIVCEDERDGKRENSPSAPGSTHRFEEGTREPARVHDVGEERIAECRRTRRSYRRYRDRHPRRRASPGALSSWHASACQVSIARSIAASV